MKIIEIFLYNLKKEFLNFSKRRSLGPNYSALEEEGQTAVNVLCEKKN